MAGETTLGTAVVPIKATLDSLERDLTEAKAKTDAAAKKMEASFSRLNLSGLTSTLASVGATIASKVAAPLQALGRVPINAVTASVQGLGSALAIPSKAAGALVSTLGRISAAPIGALKASVGGLASAFTAPIRAIGGLTQALGTVGLATMGIRAVVDAAKGLYNALGAKIASDINESWNKVQVVFGKGAGAIDDWSKTAADALGLSRAEALETAGTYGNLFKTLGISEKLLPSMSKDVIKLAADLSSFNNVPTPEVLEAIRSGLVGESEPMRRFGVNLNETAVAEEAVRLGLAKTTKNVSDQAKVQARLSLITKQSATAQNDFANTSSGMANASRRISAGLANIQAAIGEKLLPLLAPLIADFASKLPGAIDALTGPLDWLGKAVGKLPDLFGDLKDAVQALFSGDLDTTIMRLSTMLLRVFGPDAVLPFIRTWDSLRSTVEKLKPVIDPLIDTVKGLGQAIVDLVTGKVDLGGFLAKIGSTISTNAGKLWDGLKSVGGTLLSKLPGIASTVTTWLGEQWKNIRWDQVWAKVTGIAANIGSKLGSVVSDVTAWLGEQWKQIRWSEVWSTVKDVVGKAVSAIGSIASDVLDWLKGVWLSIEWDKVWGAVKDAVGAVISKAVEIGGQVLEWLTGVWKSIKWTEVWKAAVGIGQGLLDAGLNMTKEFATWLGKQISGADPKVVYGGMPPPPTPATSATPTPTVPSTAQGPFEQGYAAGQSYFEGMRASLNKGPATPFVINLGPLGAGFNAEFQRYIDSAKATVGAFEVGRGILASWVDFELSEFNRAWETDPSAQGMKTFFGGIGAGISTFFTTTIPSWGSTLSTEVGKWGPLIGGGLDTAWTWVTGNWNAAAQFSTWLGSWLNGSQLAPVLTQFFTDFKTTWDAGWTATGIKIDLGPTLASIGTTLTDFKTNTWDPFWTGVSTTVSNTIQGITDAWNNSTIGQAVNEITKLIGEGFQELYDRLVGHSIIPDLVARIQSLWDGLVGPITNTVNGIRDSVSGAFNSLKDNVTGAINSTRDNIKGAVNSMIGFLNRLIGGWNKLSFKIPGFNVDLPSVDVPGVGRVGGGSLGWGGVNVQTPNVGTIPTLDTGGLVTKPTLAMLAANRQPELVIPLSAMPALRAPTDRYSAAVASLGAAGSGGGDVTIHAPITMIVRGNADPEKIAEAVDRRLHALAQSTASRRNRLTLGY